MLKMPRLWIPRLKEMTRKNKFCLRRIIMIKKVKAKWVYTAVCMNLLVMPQKEMIRAFFHELVPLVLYLVFTTTNSSLNYCGIFSACRIWNSVLCNVAFNCFHLVHARFGFNLRWSFSIILILYSLITSFLSNLGAVSLHLPAPCVVHSHLIYI